MTSHPDTPMPPPAALGGWIKIAGLVAAASLVVLVVTQALINGPEARAIMERQRSAEIAQESQDFCNELGMGSGTQGFGKCTGVLAQIRNNHEERTRRYYDMF